MKPSTNHHDHALMNNVEMRKLVQHVEDHKRETGATTVRIPLMGNPNMTPSTYYAVNAFLEYRAYGKQTFKVGPNLAEGFCNTGLQSVPREALKMPYPCFWLELPECPWKIWSPQTGYHEVRGAYIWMLDDDLTESGQSIADPERMVIWIWGAPNENSKDLNDHACSWAEFSLGECFAEGGDLEDYMTETFKPYRETNDPGNGSMPASKRDEQTDLMKGVFRIAINLMLYLQTEIPELEKPAPVGGKVLKKQKKHESRRAGRRSRKEAKGTVTTLAPSVERDLGEQKAHAIQNPDKVARWVRGHWQHYFYGSGDTRRRLPKWKLPYIRNLDSELIGRDREYDVRPPADT